MECDCTKEYGATQEGCPNKLLLKEGCSYDKVNDDDYEHLVRHFKYRYNIELQWEDIHAIEKLMPAEGWGDL